MDASAGEECHHAYTSLIGQAPHLQHVSAIPPDITEHTLFDTLPTDPRQLMVIGSSRI